MKIIIEIMVCGRKWAIVCAYQPPPMRKSTYNLLFYFKCIKYYRLRVHFDHIFVIGDLNYDLIKPDKSQPLHTVYDIFDFTNLINTPTCYMKDAHSSVLDVTHMNRPSLLFNVTCSISDWHNIFLVLLKCVPSTKEMKS